MSKLVVELRVTWDDIETREKYIIDPLPFLNLETLLVHVTNDLARRSVNALNATAGAQGNYEQHH